MDLGDENDAVGLTGSDRCTEVVHVFRGLDHDERWGRRCGGPAVVTMSPEGSWLLTGQLGLVDAARQLEVPLAPSTDVGDLPAETAAYCASDDVVLLALPTGVVRCDVIDRECERATSGPVELP